MKKTVSQFGEENFELKEQDLSSLDQRSSILAGIMDQRAAGLFSAPIGQDRANTYNLIAPGEDSVNESHEVIVGLTSDATENNQIQLSP